MIKVSIILFIIISFSPAYSQEGDTLKLNLRLLDLPYQQYYFSDDYYLNDTPLLNFDLPASTDTNAIWLWTSAALANQNNKTFRFGESSPHMLQNFHEMYIENSKFNIVRTVLGAAQLGAVGYLAYKHIKKHGFLK